MSDEAFLLCVLGLLYLVECAHWLPTHCLAFVGDGSAEYTLRVPLKFLGNDSGSLVILNPLPPLGLWLRAWQFQLSLSPTAIYAYVAVAPGTRERPKQTGLLASLDQIRTVAANDTELLVNGEVAIASSSPLLTERMYEFIRKLQPMPETKRASAIRKVVAAAFDVVQVRSKIEQATRDTRGLRWLCHWHCVFLFLMTPAVLLTLHSTTAKVTVLVIGYVAGVVALAVVFGRLRRKFFQGRSGEYFKPLAGIVIYPPVALRALDAVGHRLVESFHPLAVAAAACSRESFAELAREYVLDLKYPKQPVCPSTEQVAVETEA